MKKHIVFLLILFSAIWAGNAVDAAIIVGRISHIEGQIYRYMDVDDSWAATSLQSPAGTQDLLATGNDSKTEIAFPNKQLVRLDENTEIEILNLNDDSGEFSLHSGFARFYNRNSAGRLLIETARGAAVVEPGSAVDVRADEQSVTVSAVHGEAIFYSYQEGVEKVDVISGSTSLEFRENSIIAGIGPIDWKWDGWCEDREGVLSKNRLVRSEHLPESMQEYAYVLEPYGRWQKIYYSGYYYWAWKPHSVAVGWSPYTTGYWNDWQGSPVWIDNNPWGWATHHHGNWINMHGAWLWTPYIHVSHVPGVIVIGFNITFGKQYRPHWHPGRVRWIAYNDNVGWLPLAPRETYYGYRKWGPGTVVLGGGANFSININLSSHKHIDQAVIIPKRNLYQRKPGLMNNYNTVKIKNMNKTVIVKNYKILPTAKRLRDRKNSTKVAKTRKTERENEIQRERNVEKARTNIRRDIQERTGERLILAQRNMSKGRKATGTDEKDSSRTIAEKHSGVIEKNRVGVREKATQARIVRSEQKTRERTVEKREKSIVKSRVAVSDRARKSLANEDRSQKGDNEASPVQVEISGNRITRQESKTVVARKKKTDDGKQAERESRLTQRQAEQNQNRGKKANKERGGGNRAKEELEEDSRAGQTGKKGNDGQEGSASRKKRELSQRLGGDLYSASLDSRRAR